LRVTFLRAAALAAIALTALTAAAERTPVRERAAGQIAAVDWPYLPGSILPVRVEGFSPPYHVALVGTGSLRHNGDYAIGSDAQSSTTTLIAGNAAGLAQRALRVGAPPSAHRSLVAVASYDDGVVFHDAANFSVIGVLATGGTPSDASFDALGRLAITDTQGTKLTIARLSPWNVRRFGGVPVGDELAIDERSHAIFVTDRDVGGKGALTRVNPDGTTVTVDTGETAEGVVVDERRQIVYVANVNDGTVAAIDARTMHVLRRFPAVARVFSLALSPDGDTLYAISNQSAGSPFAAPGSAIAISLRGKHPRVVARSRPLAFPIGAALDPATATLFVTDESADQIDVLDARTLRAKRPPVRTCRTPWKPALDLRSDRLYVPCAQANLVDVLDARSLRRVRGAPFRTGGYPLAVTVWHPPAVAKRSPER
jgi:DNA-binding beta-propeller fold protein YncE